MDRRDFIKQSGVAAALAATGTGAAAAAAHATPVASEVASPAVQSSARELRLAMPWAQNGLGFDDSARRLAHSIATLSGGRYRLTVQPATAKLASMADGQADIYHGPSHDFTALDPAFAYFGGLPGSTTLRPTYLNAWLNAGGGQSQWDHLAAQHGFKPLLCGHAGARSKLWSRVPLTDIADLKGLRVAAPIAMHDVLRTLEVTPIALAPAEVGMALRSGQVDAVEWAGTIAAYACDLQEGTRHCLRPGLWRNGFASVLAISSEIWSGMSDTDQAVFAAAAAQELNTSVAETLAHSRPLRLALGERHVIAFDRTPKDVTAAALTAADAYVERIAAGSPAASRIHSSFTAFRAGLPASRRRAEPPVA